MQILAWAWGYCVGTAIISQRPTGRVRVQVEVCEMWEKLWGREGIAKLESDEREIRFQP